LLYGVQDKCTSIGGVRRFISGVSSSDKTMREVVGGYHELLMGPESGQCTQQLTDWILDHAQAAQKTAPAPVTSNL
jgi:acylglycerol lipase